jgi:hydroxymethylbilane synthase
VTSFRIGTRGSQLALWQANTVKAMLEQRGHAVELVIIKTTGDRLSEAALSEAGGKRLFVKEIEDAMLKREVDLAVHSSKDMPADLPPGLGIAAVLPRENPQDAIVLPLGRGKWRHEPFPLPPNGETVSEPVSFGTSSIRRVAQLRAAFVSATFQPVRGNVDTRLRKLDEGGYDALILAAAGLRRLGLGERISALLPIDICTPAPGQGAIAIEIRDGDARTRDAVAALDDRPTAIALEAERALVAALGGGCQLPLGGIAVPDGRDRLALDAVVISADASRIVREHATGPVNDAAGLGRRVADALGKRGASLILDEIRAAQEK